MRRLGVYGHRVTMLDFSPERLAHFRAIGDLVEFYDKPGVVETALSLSGSAAQSKIQILPGGLRLLRARQHHRRDARGRLSHPGRDHAREGAEHAQGGDLPAHRGQVGVLSLRCSCDGECTHSAGSPISWSADDIVAGQIEGVPADGVLR